MSVQIANCEKLKVLIYTTLFFDLLDRNAFSCAMCYQKLWKISELTHFFPQMTTALIPLHLTRWLACTAIWTSSTKPGNPITGPLQSPWHPKWQNRNKTSLLQSGFRPSLATSMTGELRLQWHSTYPRDYFKNTCSKIYISICCALWEDAI